MENGQLTWIANFIWGTAADPLRGLFETTIQGEPRVVEYEPDTDIRDTEHIPFLECPACHEPGYLPSPDDQRAAIETFLRREVLPHAPDLPASPRQAGLPASPRQAACRGWGRCRSIGRCR